MRSSSERRSAVAPLAIVAMTLAARGSLAAEDLDGVFRLFATDTREQSTSATGQGATLDVRMSRQVTSVFSYLFSVRTTFTQQEPLLGSSAFETRERQLEPRLELRLSAEPYEWSVGDRWQRFADDFPSGQPDSVRTENNLYSRFRTRSEDLPEALLEYDRRDGSRTGAPDTTTDRLLAQLSYSGESWAASGGRRRTTESTAPSFRRTTDETLLSASLNRFSEDGRYSITGGATFNDLRNVDRLSVASVVVVPRTLRQGLSAQDPIPADGALSPTPPLADGNRTTASTVNIGGGLAGGQAFWNIGFELSVVLPVDTVDLWLDAPIPAASALRYAWAAYESVDGTNWTAIAGSVTSAYDSFEGRFRLSFPSVTSRFVKVVNTTIDDTLPAVLVTEIEAFSSEEREGTIHSSTTTGSASVTAVMTPKDGFTATVGAFDSRITTDSDLGAEIRTEDRTGSASVELQPSPTLVAIASLLTSRRTRTAGDTEGEDSYGLTLTALPLQDLDLTLVFGVREQTRGAQSATTESYLFRVASLLLPDLSVSADYGKAAEEQLDGPPRERETVHAGFDARPREELEIGSYLLAEWITTPSLAPPLRDQHFVNWNNRLTIRPSSVFLATLSGVYVRSPGQGGWSWIAQVDWLPLPGGAMQLSVDYRRDRPLLGQERALRTLHLRWNLNRRMFLDLDASRQSSTDVGQATSARTILSAFFQARF